MRPLLHKWAGAQKPGLNRLLLASGRIRSLRTTVGMPMARVKSDFLPLEELCLGGGLIIMPSPRFPGKAGG